MLADGRPRHDMTKLNSTIAALLAMLSGACSSDGKKSPSAAGTGGSAGTGGALQSGGETGVTDGGEAPSCEGTQTADPKFSQAMQVLRDTLAKDNIPGGAIAVIQDGQIANIGVAGSKSASVCDPITPDTLFQSTGVSPFITALAVLDAVEDGKLSLTAPITDVVPTLTVTNGDASEITLHHLLSGNSNYWAENLSSGTQASACIDSLADAFVNATNPILKASPGSMPDYLFLNWELAGLALQNADGKPFVDAVTERVLAPLSMGGTYDPASFLANDHALESGSGDAYGRCPNAAPSDGYSGSIRDVAKLVQYLSGGQGSILDPSGLDTMLANQGPFFFSAAHVVYGGIGATHDDFGGDLVMQAIIGMGFSSAVRIYRQRGLALITLFNASAGAPPWPADQVNEAIAPIYDPTLKPWFAPPFNDLAYAPDPTSLPSLVGTYRDDLGFKGTGPRTLTVSVDPTDSGKLIGTVTGSDGASDAVSFDGAFCADNFTITLGTNPLPATDLWRYVRFWRDAAGNGSAIQLYGDNGPPFLRLP